MRHVFYKIYAQVGLQILHSRLMFLPRPSGPPDLAVKVVDLGIGRHWPVLPINILIGPSAMLCVTLPHCLNQYNLRLPIYRCDCVNDYH